ncbi:MAG: hypothetical protein QOG30_801 [Acidimicrobiaceae bacterium]
MIRRVGAALVAITLPAATLMMVGGTASAAIVSTVGLGTASNYSVLGAATVTNTGDSVLHESLGLSPGTDITGFPPGEVVAPGTTDTTNEAAAQGQADLTAAYLNAKARSVDANTPVELANLQLQAGVYAGPGPGKAPLTLNGPLTLDGAGDPNSVFIFQTDSSLITGAGSTVTLINGAQECNVFWQVGSSATLGTGSDFTGNIMALTSIWFTDSVTVHGRALATTGEVTLINDTFVEPTCDLTTPVGEGGGGGGGGSSDSTTPGGGPGSGEGTTPGTPGGPGGPGITTGGPNVPGVVGPPRTGAAPLSSGNVSWLALLCICLLAATATGAVLTRRTQ